MLIFDINIKNRIKYVLVDERGGGRRALGLTHRVIVSGLQPSCRVMTRRVASRTPSLDQPGPRGRNSVHGEGTSILRLRSHCRARQTDIKASYCKSYAKQTRRWTRVRHKHINLTTEIKVPRIEDFLYLKL